MSAPFVRHSCIAHVHGVWHLVLESANKATWVCASSFGRVQFLSAVFGLRARAFFVPFLLLWLCVWLLFGLRARVSCVPFLRCVSGVPRPSAVFPWCPHTHDKSVHPCHQLSPQIDAMCYVCTLPPLIFDIVSLHFFGNHGVHHEFMNVMTRILNN